MNKTNSSEILNYIRHDSNWLLSNDWLSLAADERTRIPLLYSRWLAIYNLALHPDPARSESLDAMDATLLARYLAGSTRIIFSNSSTFHPSLEEIKISSDFAHGLGSGNNFIDTLLGKVDVTHEFADSSRYTPRIKDAIRSAQIREKLTINPFTCDIDRTKLSIYPECFFYSGEQEYLLLCWASIDNPQSDAAWLLPSSASLVVNHEAGLSLELAIANLAELFHYRIIKKLSVAQQPEPTGVCMHESIVPHIGHYIWNGLSSWAHVFPHISHNVVCAYDHRCIAFGGLRSIYSRELEHSQILEFSGYGNLMDKCLEQNLLPVNCRGSFVSKSFSERVVAYATHVSSSVFREEVLEHLSTSSLLVSFGIRTGNRSWVGQVEGIVEIIEFLIENYPTPSILLDGLNCDGLKGWTTSSMDISEELAIASIIQEKVGDRCKIFNLINQSLADNIFALCNSHFFVAPMGAGLAKMRWICNLPGVIHSNPYFLDPSFFHSRLYDAYMDEPTPSLYLDPSESLVIPSDEYLKPTPALLRSNYDLNAKALIDKVRHLADSLLSSRSCHQEADNSGDF